MEDVVKLELAAEQVEVSKRQSEGETVRVSIGAEVEDRHLTLSSVSEDIAIETVDINQEITEVPPVCTVGNVTIIPVIEEVEVVTKRLILKQEIRVTKTRTESESAVTVPLRTEHAVVERIPPLPNDLEP